jgi:hypothetical protein
MSESDNLNNTTPCIKRRRAKLHRLSGRNHYADHWACINQLHNKVSKFPPHQGARHAIHREADHTTIHAQHQAEVARQEAECAAQVTREELERLRYLRSRAKIQHTQGPAITSRRRGRRKQGWHPRGAADQHVAENVQRRYPK